MSMLGIATGEPTVLI